MSVSAADVKKLREQTQAGMMACKAALEETGNDFSAAVDLLRKKGEAKAAKVAGKTVAEGRIAIAMAPDNKTAVLLEVNCQTDFVGRDENFVAFSDELAQAILHNEANDIAAALALAPAKSAKTFEEWRTQLVSKLGENIQARRFAKLEANMVGQYCHGNRIGVLVALDVVDEALARDVAMHIAASNPLAISAAGVPAEVIAKEKEIFTAQAKETGKPDNIIEKMIEGRVSKFLKEVSLVDQGFVKNPDQTVGQLLKEKKATVLRFERFELGEGIEVEEQDFAAEVMAQIKG